MPLTTATLMLTAFALFFGMLACEELGRRIGRRRRADAIDDKQHGTGVIEAAVFGLFGLLIAFKFSAAAARLETRQQHAVQEANAIGTAYLRLDLLPEVNQPPLRELFRRYTQTRIRAYDAIPDIAAAEAEIIAAQGLQGEIWSRAIATTAQPTSTAPPLLLLPALNEMIDMTTTRDTMLRTHVPVLIVIHTVVVALLCALLAGRAMSASPHRHLFHSTIFAAVIAVTFYVVLDLEYPRLGVIHIGAADQAMRDVLRSMGG